MSKNKEMFIIIVFIVNIFCSLVVGFYWWFANLSSLKEVVILFLLLVAILNLIAFIILIVNRKVKQIFLLLATFFITGFALTILLLDSWFHFPRANDLGSMSIEVDQLELPNYSDWLTFDSTEDAGMVFHFTVLYPNDLIWEKGEGDVINFYQKEGNGELVKKFIVIVNSKEKEPRIYNNLMEHDVSIGGYQGVGRLGVVPEDADPELYISAPGEVERNDVVADISGMRFELVFNRSGTFRNSILHNINFDF